MAITAEQVKDLRARTGAGMMECKKALVETEGDLDGAVEVMRRRGLAKADKKAGRVAAEGSVVACHAEDGRSGTLVEINCETDFVAAGEDFRGFAAAVAERALAAAPADTEALLGLAIQPGGETIETAQKELIARLGENIQIRRFAHYQTSGVVASYLHGERIGVMLELHGGDHALARDICMHIAASQPLCLGEDDLPEDRRDQEKQVLAAQARDSGKPEEIIQRMVDGRFRKWLAEVTLLGQPFVKDTDQTVAQLLESHGASVTRFTRFEVGEGKEKKEENFAEEVAAQVKGS